MSLIWTTFAKNNDLNEHQMKGNLRLWSCYVFKRPYFFMASPPPVTHCWRIPLGAAAHPWLHPLLLLEWDLQCAAVPEPPALLAQQPFPWHSEDRHRVTSTASFDGEAEKQHAHSSSGSPSAPFMIMIRETVRLRLPYKPCIHHLKHLDP